MISFARSPASPDKEAFHRYLADFSAVEDDSVLLDKFVDCTDVLPMRYAELLFLPSASTYRDAVALLLTSWKGAFHGACDWQDPKPESMDG